MNNSNVKENLRANWSIILNVLLIIVVIIFVRSCRNQETIDTIPETPSSKEYVDSLLNQISIRDIHLESQDLIIANLHTEHKRDSLEHVKEVLAYKKLTRKEKVLVIEGNVGPVIDTLGLTCLDSFQMDSVNLTYKELSRSKEEIWFQGEVIKAKSKKIDLLEYNNYDYSIAVDTLIIENVGLREENGDLRVASKKFIKKIRRNRKIAIVASVVAALEGVLIYNIIKNR
jgi:hypothetical protein